LSNVVVVLDNQGRLESIIAAVGGCGSRYEESFGFLAIGDLFGDQLISVVPGGLFFLGDVGEGVDVAHQVGMVSNGCRVGACCVVDGDVSGSLGLLSLIQRVLLLEHH
jgi:hypothetical protein